MTKATGFRFSLVFFIFIISITQVKSQNDDMEEAEILPITHLSTTVPTTTTPDLPYPHNILRTEVYSDPSSSNHSCIIFQGALQLYLNSSSLFGKHALLKIDVPVNANSSGFCGNLTQTLIFDWNDYESQNIGRGYSLEFQFGFGTAIKNEYDIQEVILNVTAFNATTESKELLGMLYFEVY